MKSIVVNGVRIAYRIDETAAGRPWIVFSHSLACDHRMWDPQVPAFRDYRLLRYDTRGHGASDAPPGDYPLEALADDLKGLLDALGIETCHFVGLSMGGMIGQEFALRYPSQVATLTLADTTSRYPAEAAAIWEQRLALVRSEGMAAIAPSTLERWFTAGFRAAQPEVVARIAETIRSTPVAGYAGCAYAISRINLTARLSAINCPTLVIVGDEDIGTPPSMAEEIARAIPGARLQVLPAAHLSSIEQADRFNTVLHQFVATSS
jgi:3-oxoadipate enol-lactonase